MGNRILSGIRLFAYNAERGKFGGCKDGVESAEDLQWWLCLRRRPRMDERIRRQCRTGLRGGGEQNGRAYTGRGYAKLCDPNKR